MKTKIERTKYASLWRKRLTNQLGEETGTEILTEADRKYQNFCQENCSDSDALKLHTEKCIYPLIALYQTLLKYFDKKKTIELLETLFVESVSMQAKTLRNFVCASNLQSVFPKTFAEEMQKQYSEDAGFVIDWNIITNNKAQFNIKTCPYLETVKKYHCSEICYLFCLADELCYNNISESLHWKRTGTLAEEKACCDFSLEYAEEK